MIGIATNATKAFPKGISTRRFLARCVMLTSAAVAMMRCWRKANSVLPKPARVDLFVFMIALSKGVWFLAVSPLTI